MKKSEQKFASFNKKPYICSANYKCEKSVPKHRIKLNNYEDDPRNQPVVS